MTAAAAQTLHASCVADAGRAMLILGPSGAGKSALALQLIALGARLVADDRTIVTLRDGHPVASCPDPLRGLIEARGIGLLRVDPAPPTPVALAVDLSRAEPQRLPPARTLDLLGTKVGLVLALPGPHLAAALLVLLRGGTVA